MASATAASWMHCTAARSLSASSCSSSADSCLPSEAPSRCRSACVGLVSAFSGASVRPKSEIAKLGPQGGSKWQALFRFGKFGFNSADAGMYGSQGRDDYDKDDVEQYFNYMGMLATEGTYDKMQELLNQKIHPVDILLLLAASEGDRPKIEELLKAGADINVKDASGRTAVDRAANEDIKELLLQGAEKATKA